jgi:hypothetical protein
MPESDNRDDRPLARYADLAEKVTELLARYATVTTGGSTHDRVMLCRALGLS